MARRKPRYIIVSQALVRGELLGRFVAERSTFEAAVAKAVKDAKIRGYHASVKDAHDESSYLAICAPQRKRGRSYAQCKLSTRGRQLLAQR